MTQPTDYAALRKKTLDYVEAAYLHGLPVENLDTSKLEPPCDIADVEWIADALLNLYQRHEEAVVSEVIGEDDPTPEYEPDPEGEKGIFTEAGLNNAVKSAQFDWTGYAHRTGLRKQQRQRYQTLRGEEKTS